MNKVDTLNFEVADVIYDSWDAVKKIPDYDIVVGGMIFRKIFETAPKTLKLFSFGPGFSGKKAELYNSRTFNLHSKAVVKMLDDVLSMIMPDLVPLKRTLKALGARHVSYGVVPLHYGFATEALLSTLESILGDAWTPQVEEGWKTAFGFISNTMIAGANKHLKKKRKMAQQRPSQAESTSSDNSTSCDSTRSPNTALEQPIESPVLGKDLSGRKVAFDLSEDWDKKSEGSVKDHDDNTMSTSGTDSLLDHWEDSDINYMKFVENVYESWDTIKQIPNYSEVAGTLIFQNIFKTSPTTRDLFLFAKSYGENDEAIYKDIGFLIHSKSVIKMVDTCVGMMGPDMEPVSKALEDLGARHCQYNIMDAHYPILGAALLKTLETVMGDAWTPAVKEAWTEIFDFMSNAMQKGASEYLDEILESQLEEI